MINEERDLDVWMDDEPNPERRRVTLRTMTLGRGVLCDVDLNGHSVTCLIECATPDLHLRRLPGQRFSANHVRRR